MSGFAWALAGFVALHLGVAATGLRAAIIVRIGAGAYRIVFALASLALLVWMIHGFAAMRRDPFDPLNQDFWSPADWLRWPGYALVLLGFVFAASGLSLRNPTMAGMEGALAKPEPARGILRVTRHPFLWGVAFWAGGHVLVNGERFAPMLFGALGLMAIYGARSIDRKLAARDPEHWPRFAAVTSNAPFVAIAQGRNRLALGEMWLRLAAGAAAFVLFGLFHQQIVGQPAF